MLGIAGSFYDPAQGSVRPVYLHEACHALIARTFGLASQGVGCRKALPIITNFGGARRIRAYLPKTFWLVDG